MTAYCTAASLATYLGRALTAAEAASASAACAAVTDAIDQYLQQTWQGLTITGEVQTVKARTVYLDWSPIASVTSVTARLPLVGETPTVLVAGTDYELIDASEGALLVAVSLETILTITYVTASPAPANVQQAANIIAAQYLVSAPAYSNQTRGIQKLKAGSAEITYDPIDRAMSIPPHVDLLLRRQPTGIV